MYDTSMTTKSEAMQHDIDVLRLQLLGIAAKLEQTLYDLYNSDVLEGSISHTMFFDNVHEMFGNTIAEALYITIQGEPYD